MSTASTHFKPDSHIIQSVGTAMECSDNGIIVSTTEGVFCTRRAISCLVEPLAGDSVLLAGDPDKELYVIAVLQRSDPSSIRISVDGDLTVGVSKGSFSVAAAHGVNLVSAGEMTLTSSELTVNASKGNIFFDQLSYLGSRIFAEIDRVKLIGRFFDAVLERISHKVKCSYRMVEEIDHVRSNVVDYRASKNMSLRGQNTLITAKELVKIDGDQIHLG